MESEPKYSVGVVSQLTELTPETLRAWERRYRAVTPHREEKGRRYYDAAQVERLRLLKAVTELGHPIRHVATLDADALRALLGREPDAENSGAVARALRQRLRHALAVHDPVEFDRLLGQAGASLPVADLVHRVLVPILGDIGARWADDSLSIAQEHRASAGIRNLLGTLLRSAPKPKGPPRMVLATLAGERHEFGLLLVHLLSAHRGIPCEYLGTDLPSREIAHTAARLGCRVVGLSVVGSLRLESAAERLRELSRAVEPGTAIWLGGSSAPRLGEMTPDVDAPVAAGLDEFWDVLGG